jgi:hypothetical protein
MKKLIFALLFGAFASANAAGQSGSFSDDYVWQERFTTAMSRAENGIAKAQYSVGEMYEKGRGTQKDVGQAFSWYQKASAQRHMKAQYKLGYMYYKGLGVQKNTNKAYELFKKPANKGNVRAQYYLGKLYDNGQGVTRDREKALLWYSRSSLGGYTPAEEALVNVKKYLASLEAAPKFSSKRAVKKTKTASKTTKKPAKKQSKAKKAAPVKVAKTSSLSGKILQGAWMKRKKPAEFLPSKITKCKRQSATVLECVSRKLKRNIGNADITYITKAILFEMKKSGDFKVAYRNNVLKIKKHVQVVDDDDDEEGSNAEQKVTVKKGWQETEHKLECKIKDKATINCVKNKTRKLKFSSKRVS